MNTVNTQSVIPMLHSAGFAYLNYCITSRSHAASTAIKSLCDDIKVWIGSREAHPIKQKKSNKLSFDHFIRFSNNTFTHT